MRARYLMLALVPALLSCVTQPPPLADHERMGALNREALRISAGATPARSTELLLCAEAARRAGVEMQRARAAIATGEPDLGASALAAALPIGAEAVCKQKGVTP